MKLEKFMVVCRKNPVDVFRYFIASEVYADWKRRILCRAVTIEIFVTKIWNQRWDRRRSDRVSESWPRQIFYREAVDLYRFNESTTWKIPVKHKRFEGRNFVGKVSSTNKGSSLEKNWGFTCIFRQLNLCQSAASWCNYLHFCQKLKLTVKHLLLFFIGPAPAPKTSNVVIALVISVSLCFLVLITVIIWWCCRYSMIKHLKRLQAELHYTTFA